MEVEEGKKVFSQLYGDLQQLENSEAKPDFKLFGQIMQSADQKLACQKLHIPN